MKLHRHIIPKTRYIPWRNILFNSISHLLMLTFSGTSRVSPLTEVLWDRPIRGPDGWYRTSPRACKVPSVTSPDSLRAILMNRRTSWRSDSSSGIDGCTFRNLLEKNWKSLIFRFTENPWHICTSVENIVRIFLTTLGRQLYQAS